MAKRKEQDAPTPTPHLEKGITHRAAIALLKGSGSAALGATVAVVEVEGGERAGKGARMALAVVGVASEIMLDPEEHPIATEAGKASLHSAAAVTAYKGVKQKAEEYKKSREQKERDRMVSQLKADLYDDEIHTNKGEGADQRKSVPVPKATKKTTKKPANTEG